MRRVVVRAGIGVVVVMLAAAYALVIHTMSQKKMEEKEEYIAELEAVISEYEMTSAVYRLKTDVKSENECIETELELVELPVSLITEDMVQDEEDVLGLFYKLGFQAGTILTKDMMEEFVIEDDMRYMDVVLDEIPIGLEEGDYIDIRIAFPLGQDYIALSGKRVAQINGSTVKLIVDGKDFYYYESMKTDMAMYKSTKIYGAQYVEVGIQEKAQTYYPVNLEVLHTMLLDPHIDTGDYSSVIKTREQLEGQLLDSELVDIAKTVTMGKNEISKRFEEASKEYEKIQEKKEKEAAKNESNVE